MHDPKTANGRVIKLGRNFEIPLLLRKLLQLFNNKIIKQSHKFALQLRNQYLFVGRVTKSTF